MWRSKSKHQTPTLHFRDSYGLITQFRFDLPCSRLCIDPSQNGPRLHQSSLHVPTAWSLITVLLIKQKGWNFPFAKGATLACAGVTVADPGRYTRQATGGRVASSFSARYPLLLSKVCCRTQKPEWMKKCMKLWDVSEWVEWCMKHCVSEVKCNCVSTILRVNIISPTGSDEIVLLDGGGHLWICPSP